uniref:Uncharacterized protein n=1 Tax=Proboscia inermis TaxID=420281 RepID=A0A7S0C623_9STRA|mmetsp:Transcript_29487/g.29886  ORF Transcript_29487/g.29886 Transcript_29487/m.29886 type:complete len:246 (+) Transcript_29487:304-1041(+)
MIKSASLIPGSFLKSQPSFRSPSISEAKGLKNLGICSNLPHLTFSDIQCTFEHQCSVEANSNNARNCTNYVMFASDPAHLLGQNGHIPFSNFFRKGGTCAHFPCTEQSADLNPSWEDTVSLDFHAGENTSTDDSSLLTEKQLKGAILYIMVIHRHLGKPRLDNLIGTSALSLEDLCCKQSSTKWNSVAESGDGTTKRSIQEYIVKDGLIVGTLTCCLSRWSLEDQRLSNWTSKRRARRRRSSTLM